MAMNPKDRWVLTLTLIGGATILTFGGILMLIRWQSPAPRTVLPYDADVICPDAFKTQENHEHEQINNFTVHMTEGCFGHLIHMPSAWHRWNTQPVGDHKGWWVAYWWSGWPRGQGPFGPNDQTELSIPSWWFRVQGHGDILFYSNDVVPEASTPSQPAGSPLPKMRDLEVRKTDPHICDKPDDAYFPRAWASGDRSRFYDPKFLFNREHPTNSVDWAGDFRGTVPVCFIIEVTGLVDHFTFPQPPGADLEKHIIDDMSTNHYSPGTLNSASIRVQMAYDIIFR
jgi:hypothetical protein